MQPYTSFTLFFAVILLVLPYGCTKQNRLDLLRYKKRVLEERAKKDNFFKYSDISPIPSTEKWQFTELNYFPVDPQYQVRARYFQLPEKEELIVPTSTGQSRVYVKIGLLEFVLSGTPLELIAYQEKAWLESGEPHPLFVPFTDKTTGQSTYGAGRYLDVPIPDSDEAVLDFNFAYNPYCTYNATYSCPVPPSENSLPVNIEAGEKKYKEF